MQEIALVAVAGDSAEALRHPETLHPVGWPAAHGATKKKRAPFFFGWPAAHGAKKTRPVFFLVGWPAAHGTKKKTRPVFLLVGPPRTEQKKKRAPCCFWSARRARSKKNAPRVFFGRPAAHGTKKRDLQKSAPNKKNTLTDQGQLEFFLIK